MAVVRKIVPITVQNPIHGLLQIRQFCLKVQPQLHIPVHVADKGARVCAWNKRMLYTQLHHIRAVCLAGTKNADSGRLTRYKHQCTSAYLLYARTKSGTVRKSCRSALTYQAWGRHCRATRTKAHMCAHCKAVALQIKYWLSNKTEKKSNDNTLDEALEDILQHCNITQRIAHVISRQTGSKHQQIICVGEVIRQGSLACFKLLARPR